MENLFAEIDEQSSGEIIEVLQRGKNVRIERIISRGHSSTEGFWYDQVEHEWVVVLRGSGTVLLQDPDKTITLNSGDYLYIPAHRKHRVEATAADGETIWLAIFYQD